MKTKLLVAAMLLSGFLGGGVSHCPFSGGSQAYAQETNPTLPQVVRAERFEGLPQNGKQAIMLHASI